MKEIVQEVLAFVIIVGFLCVFGYLAYEAGASTCP